MARLPRIGAVLGLASVAMMTTISLVAVEVPKTLSPVTEFAIPYLREGRVSVNPQGLDDYMPDPGYVSMRPPGERQVEQSW
jgi:hypothetical protein